MPVVDEPRRGSQEEAEQFRETLRYLRDAMSGERICAYHQDSTGWDACSEDFVGECAVEQRKASEQGEPMSDRTAVTDEEKTPLPLYAYEGWIDFDSRAEIRILSELLDGLTVNGITASFEFEISTVTFRTEAADLWDLRESLTPIEELVEELGDGINLPRFTRDNISLINRCGIDYMAGQICALPADHEGPHD